MNRKAYVVLLVSTALLVALASTVRAQQEPMVRAESAQPLVFWEAVGDTTLVRLVRQTLAGNGDLRAAAARVDQARAVRTESALDLAPTVTAVAAYSRQRTPLAAVPGGVARGPDRDYWDAGIEATWEVDVFGRLRGGLRGRNALLDATESDERDAAVLVTAELARGYVALRGFQEQLAVARENAANQERTFALTQRRLESGRGNELDTERARAQLSLTRAAALELEARVTAAQYGIAVLTGREPGAIAAELETPQPMPALPGVVVPASIDALVRRRPDVVSAERRVAAAAAFHGAARADYLPRITLVGGLGTASSEFDGLGDDGTSRFTVGPVISWPLLNLGRVKAGTDAARAQRDASQAEYEQVVLRAAQEIRTAVVRYRAASGRLALLEEAAAASRRAAELARRRFESGAADFLQVLDADRTRLATEAQLAQGRAEAGTLLVGLYRATGGAM